MADNKHQHLKSLLDSFDTAFLVTHGEQGPHARPLSVVGIDGPTVVWLMTDLESPKVDEIRRDPQVMLTFQSKGKFVVLRGAAELVFERDKIDRFWTEPQRVWFPNGKDDPALVLLRVKGDEAELWDQSGARGLKFALDAAKAYATRSTPREDDERHATMNFKIARP